MSRNIKEIGKELMGKSLNSYHRKTGLTQLEKNNEMQDGILDGILSQVDDAYIEKTEQSNVIHLDNSGDGVVILDSIKGNTKLHVVNEPIKSGLVCWLEGIDGVHEDNTWVDRSGKNNNGTLVGVNHSVNKWGFKCLELGRHIYNPSCVRIPNPTLNLEQYTVELTFREYGGEYWCGLFGNTSPDGGGTNVYKGGSNIISTYPSISNGCITSNGVEKITTITVVFDCINKITKFYEDGVFKTVNDAPSLIASTSNTMVIGARKDNTASDYGYTDARKIDIYSFKVYNRCLTDSEITTNYQQQLTGITLQSSFEEQVEDDKYKIEILSRTKNIFNINTVEPKFSSTNDSQNYPSVYYIKDDSIVFTTSASYQGMANLVKTQKGKTYTFYSESPQTVRILLKPCDINNKYVYTDTIVISSTNKTITFIAEHDYYWFIFDSVSGVGTFTVSNIQMQEGLTLLDYVPHKQNKIKLLINEPLRKKDKLCIKDGKLFIERNSKQNLLNADLTWAVNNSDNEGVYSISTSDLVGIPKGDIVSDKFASVKSTKDEGVMLGITTGKVMVCINRNKLSSTTLSGIKQYLRENPTQVVFDIEPIYEEVLNEYGEPILLEGYENGTIYIDSIIVPTTTVRYTPKIESFRTLKEVSNNNIMLTNDISDTIIPYMMEVDLMIMEKEMSLFNSLNKNIRKMEVLDMTSMQKRTGEMLERLIKGKSLNEQECKTRVTVYLNANKITDEQAEELMLLISEIYA